MVLIDLLEKSNQENIRNMINRIRLEKNLSITEVCKQTKLSRPAITGFMNNTKGTGYKVLISLVHFIENNGYKLRD